MGHPGKFRRRILLAGGLVLVLELLLQLGCLVWPLLNAYFSPPPPPSHIVPQAWDAHLYQRPLPGYSGHDFRGFRNTGVVRRADIVAMGDSQTYAKGSPLQHAWPQQLEFLADQTVYNMSFGGWGPIQYGFLWEEAIALQPHTIVIGFHTPDVIDCSLSVYRRGLRREFKDAVNDPLAPIMDQGFIPPLEERKAGIFARSPNSAKVHRQQQTVPPTPYVEPPFRPTYASAPYEWKRLKLPRIIDAGDRILFDYYRPYYRKHYRDHGNIRERQAASIGGQPVRPFPASKTYAEPLGRHFRNHVTTEDLRWMMMIPKRNLEVEITSPFVAEGLRIAVEQFKELQQRADARGIRFLVALIPTKELAFSSFLLNDYPHDLPRDYPRMAAREWLLRTLLNHNLREHGIETVDVLPGLSACFQRNQLPYPLRPDSHPTADGYRAIARQIGRALDRSPAENRAPLDTDWARLVFRADPAAGHSLPSRTLVKARIIEQSPLPTVKSIFPYRGALITHLYQVEKTLWGQDPGKRILVAHWTIQDGMPLPQRWEKNRFYELSLEPFADHPRLAREYMVDETSEADAPLYYDVLSEPESEAPGSR